MPKKCPLHPGIWRRASVEQWDLLRFRGKAQLIEEDSVGKDHFSRNEVTNQ